MARGPQPSPSVAPSLPKVSFEKIEVELSTQPLGISDLQARSYGFNESVHFVRPDYYIRHIEPLESDLARQVEYDMDEQDKEWLDAINTERRKDQLDAVAYETFEVLMDRLEKEWFDLTKNIPKLDLALPSEDSTCAICDDSEGENSNAIVFCDGCNLAVHQDCYGVPYIPEGQWLCRKCTVSPENPVSCILCPNEGGAFKQTVHGEWVHLLCAIWVPETRVANDVFMEPITGIEKISKQRWKLKCTICDIREGACIQCAKTSCFLAFHATCARKERLLLPMKTTQGSEPVTLTCYCDRHLPKEQQDARAAAFAAEEAQEEKNPMNDSKLSKSARAYAKTYKPGPPLVPAIILNRISHYVGKVSLRKKPEFIAMVCRYWSLKREARRGAPLLKRLHLEPWTASAGGKIHTQEEKMMKLELLQRLRQDLEHVKELTLLASKRETMKLYQVHIIQRVLQNAIFPHEAKFRRAFENIMSADKKEWFKYPVSKAEVSDYFDIVKNPMCWSIIDGKLNRHEYWDMKTFKDDINLVIDNALLYNKPGTQHYKAALRIQTVAQTALAELSYLSSSSNKHEQNENMSINDDDSVEPLVGDLEPPLELLELLMSTDAIKDNIRLVLDADPLTYLFQYALPQRKPPPPQIASHPPKILRLKRDRKVENERQAEETDATLEDEANGQLKSDTSPTIRVPRTRRAVAIATEDMQSPTADEAEEKIVPIYTGSKRGRKKKQVHTLISDQTGTTEEAMGSMTTALEGPRRGRGRKRAITVFPQPDGLPMVENVDNQQSFKLFNKGWILPANTRRGGRMPVERTDAPPTRPKKRLRTGSAPSRLSMVSTAPSENQTLETTDDNLYPNDEMEMDISQLEGPDPDETEDSSRGPTPNPVSLGRLPPPEYHSVIPPVTMVRGADGRIIIEELDTPAIRREKSRRKEEQRRLAAQAALVNADIMINPAVLSGPGVPGLSFNWPVLDPPHQRAGPSNLTPKSEELGSDSDLSSLSDDVGETNQAYPSNEPQQPTSSEAILEPVSTEAPRRKPVIGKGTRLEGGTLVWAKIGKYPWWPAVIFEDDDPQVPLNVLRECKLKRAKTRDPDVQILRFFDKTDSWQFLPLRLLKEFGEDDELDAAMIAPVSRYQQWKTAASRDECRDAYRRARAEMETGSDIESEGGEELVPAG